jgi:hypothetical protein
MQVLITSAREIQVARFDGFHKLASSLALATVSAVSRMDRCFVLVMLVGLLCMPL